ncbi:MAG: hypothetical protein ACRD1T_04145 [Acidimicrobiia bacterium]
MNRPGRSFGAVLAGLLAITILSVATDAVLHATGVFPPYGRPTFDGLFVIATAYRIVYGVAGSYSRLGSRPIGLYSAR